MCGCILAVKKQFTYLSCTQPRSSHRTQPNKSQQGENKEKAMGRCGARAAGHSHCLRVTGGCCQSHPRLAQPLGGYVLQQGQLPESWLITANTFSQKEGDMSFSSNFQKKMVLSYSSTAPILLQCPFWYLASFHQKFLLDP